MAEKYGMLPTQILADASTFDFMIFNNASILRDRWSKQSRGENTANTYTQDEIDEVYAKFKKGQEQKNGHDSKR